MWEKTSLMKHKYYLRQKALDELKALMSIIPVALEQVERICETVEQTLYQFPELELEIKEYLIKRLKG